MAEHSAGRPGGCGSLERPRPRGSVSARRGRAIPGAEGLERASALLMLDKKRAPLARQITVSFACVLVVTLVEAIHAAVSGAEPRATAGEIAVACVDLLALYAPVGLALGLASGLAVVALSANRRARAIGLVSLSPRDLFRPRPRAFARFLSGGLALALFAAGVTYSSHEFATRFHAPWLAAGANAAAVVVLAGLAAGLRVVLSPPLEERCAALGPLASRGGAAVLAALGVGLGIYGFTRVYPELFYTYHPGRVLGPPGLLVVFAIASLGAAQLEGGPPGARPALPDRRARRRGDLDRRAPPRRARLRRRQPHAARRRGPHDRRRRARPRAHAAHRPRRRRLLVRVRRRRLRRLRSERLPRRARPRRRRRRLRLLRRRRRAPPSRSSATALTARSRPASPADRTSSSSAWTRCAPITSATVATSGRRRRTSTRSRRRRSASTARTRSRRARSDR